MRYIFLIAAFLISSLAHGQGTWNKSSTNNAWNRTKADSVLIVPRDTSATNNAILPSTGQPVGDYGRIQAKHGLFYFHDSIRNRRMAFYDDIPSGADSAYIDSYIKKDSIILRRSATDTTLLDINTGYVNVEWFGAIGDGITNNTAILQQVLDNYNKIYFPPGMYNVSGIDVKSNTTLLFGNNAKIFLINNSDRPAIQNKNFSADIDSNITIIGLTLLGNDENQIHTGVTPPYTGEYTSGIRFFGVKNLVIKDVNITRARTFGIWCARINGGTFHNIYFNQKMSGIPDNQDGLHINGPSRNIDIRNIWGRTNDDHVAINADDGYLGVNWSQGQITNVVIDGVKSDTSLNIVRLLSANSLIDNVSVKNIQGYAKDNAIAVSAFDFGPGNFGSLDINGVNVQKVDAFTNVENVFTGLIVVSDSIRSISVRNVKRGVATDVWPTVKVWRGSKIGSLLIDGVSSFHGNHAIADIRIYPSRIQTLTIKNHTISSGLSSQGIAVQLDSSNIGNLLIDGAFYKSLNTGFSFSRDTIGLMTLNNINADTLVTPIFSDNSIFLGQSIFNVKNSYNGFTSGNLGVGTTNPTPHAFGRAIVLDGTTQGRSLIELWASDGNKGIIQTTGGKTYVGSLTKGSGDGELLLLQGDGVAGMSISAFGVTTSQYRLSALNIAPSSSTDTGTLGEIRITATHIFVCVATNTWVRSALTTW